MTKSQTKMQNLTLKIQQLAKGLNKFTISDIEQLIHIDISNIMSCITQMEKTSLIKKLSNEEYLYTKIKKTSNSEKAEEIPSTEAETEDTWLTIDEVTEITGETKETTRRKCKKGTYQCKFKISGKSKEYFIKKSSLTNKNKPKSKFKKLEFNKVKETKPKTEEQFLFNTKEEQNIFDSAYDFQKKHIVKYMTIFKLAGNLVGYNLKEFLRKLAIDNPQYKTSYSTFLRKKHDYKKYGIRGLLLQLGESTRGKSVIPQNMYEDFKQLYLTSNQFSIRSAVQELVKLGYPEEVLPSHMTFKRALYREYGNDYVKNQRQVEHCIENLDLNSKNKQTSGVLPLYDYYLDAADAYVKKYSKNENDIHICRRGYIKNHLNPFFKDYKFCDIKNSTINEFVTLKLSEGYAIASINRFLSALSYIMKEYNIPKKHLQLSSSNLPLVSQGNSSCFHNNGIQRHKRFKNLPNLLML